MRIIQDLRLALRVFSRSPSATTIALISVANVVAQKTREIGIRIALGSTIRQAMIHVGIPGARARQPDSSLVWSCVQQYCE
jgi:hypothetical protein